MFHLNESDWELVFNINTLDILRERLQNELFRRLYHRYLAEEEEEKKEDNKNNKRSKGFVTKFIKFEPTNNDLSGDCVICFENLSTSPTGSLSECIHKFHYNCIIKWLQHKLECPVCRQSCARI